MRAVIIVGISILLAACGIGALTPLRSFNTNDSIVLARPATNFSQAAQEVGRSLDYHVSGVDDANRTITFSDDSSPVTGVVTGGMRFVQVTVALQADRRTVAISVMATGNMSQGTQRAAMARLERFKAALAERFN